MLEIRLLGGVGLCLEGRPVDSLKPGRALELLAFLLLERETAQPRAHLAARLWPDTDEAQARTNLRRELHTLRHALPDHESYLSIESRALAWAPSRPWRSDLSEFEAAMASDDHERAIKEYGGELLPGCYEEWLQPYRDRLHSSYCQALERCAERREERGDWPGAVAAWRALLVLEPLREELYRHMMSLHLRAGERAQAAAVYRECERALAEELGLEPDPETQEFRHLLSAPPARAAATQRHLNSLAPLIGREHEWRVAARWLDSGLREGASSVLLVSGEPGIGKTRLLEELRHAMQERGGAVIAGRGFEAERIRAYGPWPDALSGTALLRSEKANSGDRAALFDPVVDHLRQLAKEHGGLLLIMDDLQWLDEASLALLHYASRLLLGWPALVACTARTAELPRSQARQAVSSLRRDGKLKEIGLGPLTVEAIGLLAGSLNPELDREVAKSSGGNPLFVVELARSATALDESSTLGDLVANRLETLQALPRELVSWGAVLGRSFSLETLAGVSGRPLIELLEAVVQLEEHSLWRPAGEVYDFAHDVVREAAYQSLSEPRRRLLHLQAARRLSRPAQVARHAELGGDGDLASEHYGQAAQEALKVLAFAEAAELARRGLDCCTDAGPARRLKLWETAILAGLPSGLLSVAEEALTALAEQAAHRAIPEEEALASKVLSFLEFQRGRTDSLEAASWKTLEKGRGADRATAARMVAHSASCLACVQRDMAKTEAVALEALELSREAGLNLADVNHALGIVGQFLNDLGGARTHLERAVDLSRQRDGEPWQTSLFLLHLGCVLLEQEDFAAVMPVAEEIRRLASPLKDSSERAFADLLLALAQGRDPEVELEALRAFDSKRILMFGHRYQAERHLRRGELDQAWRHALTAWEAAEIMAVASEQGLAASVLVRVSLLRGQRKAAAEWVRKVRKLDPSKVGVRAMSALRRAMHEGGCDGQSGSGGQLAGAGDRTADRR